VYAFGIESLFVSHFEQGQQDVAAYFGSPWPPGNPEAIAITGYFNVKATFDLPQVFIKLTAEIGKAVIISRLEDYVPRNLDSIQCLYLKTSAYDAACQEDRAGAMSGHMHGQKSIGAIDH